MRILDNSWSSTIESHLTPIYSMNRTMTQVDSFLELQCRIGVDVSLYPHSFVVWGTFASTLFLTIFPIDSQNLSISITTFRITSFHTDTISRKIQI